MDDDDLLRRAQRGDRDAFADLVARHQDRLYTMLYRLLGNAADAADVVQETFLRAYLHIDRLNGPGVRAWLFRVAVNCGRDLQRHNARRPHDPLDDGEGNVVDLPDPSQNPERTALQRERVAEMNQLLRALPLELRVALVLREVNQLSYEEIAQVLSIPVGTVKSRVNRARMQFSALASDAAALVAAEGGG